MSIALSFVAAAWFILAIDATWLLVVAALVYLAGIYYAITRLDRDPILFLSAALSLALLLLVVYAYGAAQVLETS